jgi:hypothetical protein
MLQVFVLDVAKVDRMLHMLQWLYTHVARVCSKCFICFSDVCCKRFIWILHMFHIYVTLVLFRCCICLQ